MNILLINPPARILKNEMDVIEPLGLAYIAAVLLQKKFSVEILDLFAEKKSLEDLAQYLEKSTKKYEIIGLTGMSPLKDIIYSTAKVVRKYCKFLILGGAHVCSFKQRIFDECDLFDLLVDGEGEKVIIDVCEAIVNNDSYENILGVITKNKINKRAEFIKDLDTLPYPARDLLPISKYKHILSKEQNVASLFTSRGCPFHCIFCEKNLYGTSWRARSALNIFGEIKEIIQKYKIRSLIFYDDLFTVNKTRVIELCNLIIQNNLKIEWKCEGRVNLVDLDVLKLMKRAGCSTIAYGIETFNQNGLDFLNKGVNVSQIYSAIKLTKEAKIKVLGYIILGIPTETFEEELFTIQEAIKIGIDYPQFSLLTPHENTQLYDIGKEKGWLKEGDFQNPLDKDKKRMILLSENWDEEKLHRILKLSYIKFMTNPKFLIKKIIGVKSFRELTTLISTGFNYIKWYFHK